MAKDAKYGFGRLIDPTRAEPGMIARQDPPVVLQAEEGKSHPR